jgi:hypothetical protein
MEPAKSNQSWWIEDRKVLPSLKERKKESGLANCVLLLVYSSSSSGGRYCKQRRKDIGGTTVSK